MMKRFLATFFILSASLASGAEQMIPAGSVIQCVVSEPNLSSKTMQIGDPVLCQVSHVELYGRSVFPFESYMVGRFEEYKDPGHFVGKGWIELKFDRLVVGNDTVIPISTRVVATSGKNPVDVNGRILGTGHPVRDTVEWLIPVLWPIDLINLPRRGPRPVLKAETRLTVKILDDFGIPTKTEVQRRPELISRYNYADRAPAQQAPAPAPAPVVERSYAQVAQQQAPPWQQTYTQPNATVVVVANPTPQFYGYPPPAAVYPYPAPAVAYPYPPPAAYPYPPPAAYPYPAQVSYGNGYPPPAYGGYYRPY
jgi:hypothetical protein